MEEHKKERRRTRAEQVRFAWNRRIEQIKSLIASDNAPEMC